MAASLLLLVYVTTREIRNPQNDMFIDETLAESMAVLYGEDEFSMSEDEFLGLADIGDEEI